MGAGDYVKKPFSQRLLAELDLRGQSDVFVFDPSAVLVAQSLGAERGKSADLGNPADGGTFITDMLAGAWRGIARVIGGAPTDVVR